MLTQGLVIDEPWIGYILAGRKTWEMRSRATTKRGPIALIRKGSGLVVATATLVDSRPALTAATMPAYRDKHQISQAVTQHPDYKWFVPWVLADIRPLACPVRYKHPAGAVTFVNLEPSIIDEITRQHGQTTSVSSNDRPVIGPERPHSINVSSDDIARTVWPIHEARETSLTSSGGWVSWDLTTFVIVVLALVLLIGLCSAVNAITAFLAPPAQLSRAY